MPARILLTKFSPIKYGSVIGLAAFILFLSACSSAPPPQHPAESNIESNVKSNLALTVQDLDYEQIVSAADVYLTQTPLTITAYPPPADGGGIHEYYSQAPYFWPNPKDPNGPYVRRDGYS